MTGEETEQLADKKTRDVAKKNGVRLRVLAEAEAVMMDCEGVAVFFSAPPHAT